VLYDCLVIGAGPAGLSAAIYMGRFLRRTLVLDSGSGRSTFEQVNDNYLGFPNGIQVKELRELGRQQAERFGAEFVDTEVESMHREDTNFLARTTSGEFVGRTVILCTGVCDIWPEIPNVLDYVGKTLFWCITCDGFRALNKRVVLFGNDDDAATTACQFQHYTRDLIFISQPGGLECSDDKLGDMQTHDVPITEGEPATVEGTPDKIEAVLLKDGRKIEADVMFSLLGCTPNNKLALDLGLKVDKQGYVIMDQEGYTSVPGVFCAGDLAKMHTHQVVSAAHQGAEAGQTANYYLYAGYQKV
jgi:thioredoxin reductase (NADPH)